MTNKVSDFYITLNLENVEGLPVRAKDVTDLKVKVFTSDINTFVEFSDITISDKEDRLYIDYDLLSDLKSGVICYTYSYKLDDTNFKDKYFNSININYTNYYLRQTTLVGKDADLSQNEILAICDRKLVEQYKELKTLIDNTPKIEVDKELSEVSENPVANKVINRHLKGAEIEIIHINKAIEDIDNTIAQIKNTTQKIAVDTLLSETSNNPVANRVIRNEINRLNLYILNVEAKIPNLREGDIDDLYRDVGDLKYNKINQINQKIGRLEADVSNLSKKIDDIPKITVDTKLDIDSVNPVSNKEIKLKLETTYNVLAGRINELSNNIYDILEEIYQLKKL